MLEFPDGHMEILFLAFTSQASKTDLNGRADGPTLWEALEYRESGAGASSSSGKSGSSGSSSSTSSTRGTSKQSAKEETPRMKYPAIAIIALLLSSDHIDGGKAPLHEISLRNMTDKKVSTSGWKITNRFKVSYEIKDAQMHCRGGRLKFRVPEYMFSKDGGIVFLQGSEGKAIDSVSYTNKRVEESGRLIYFGRHLPRSLS
jgi:hypothetical protein